MKPVRLELASFGQEPGALLSCEGELARFEGWLGTVDPIDLPEALNQRLGEGRSERILNAAPLARLTLASYSRPTLRRQAESPHHVVVEVSKREPEVTQRAMGGVEAIDRTAIDPRLSVASLDPRPFPERP